MVKVPTEAITKTELVSGIVGTIDIGSIISEGLTLALDIERGLSALNNLNKMVTSNFATAVSNAATLAKQDGSAIVKSAFGILPSHLTVIHEYMRNQTVQSAGGFKIASTIIGQEAKLYSALNQIDLKNSVLFSFPEAIAKMKAARYWNLTLAPEFPNERDAFSLAQIGYWKFEDFTKLYQTEQGFNADDAKNLTLIRRNQIGKPNLKDAWSMVRKGLKKKQYFLDLAMIGQSWSKEDAEALFAYYDYDPSPSEILRLSDFVPLDSAWIDKKLTAQGLNDEDKAIYKAALEKRVLRDEINKAWGLFLDNYSWGLFGVAELKTFLESGKFTATEILWRTQTADMLKFKLRVKLMRDAEVYLYRKNVLNENQFLTRLQNLNIAYDIANAIVRNEAAKKGIDWELTTYLYPLTVGLGYEVGVA